jgi:predicted transcriptional regulator of viral defense system
MPGAPDHNCLFAVAAEQRGYFTSGQAHSCGIRNDLISHYTRRGTYLRISRGLYRLSNFPSTPREEVVAAWLAVPGQKAVVSHESALDLHGISDVIPNHIHLTVPRSMRSVTPPLGAKIHTTTRPLLPSDVISRDGIRVTSVARTIVDAAEEGTDPRQIDMAIVQALDQGLTTRQRLERAASTRSARVRALVTQSLESANP